MARHRGVLIVASGLAIFILYSLFFSNGSSYTSSTPYPPVQQKSSATGGGSVISNSRNAPPPVPKTAPPPPGEAILVGESIMPHLGNETLKAELGRASWKLFHTMLARFPVKPSVDEREALRSYIHLFARLYPCGECGAHFRLLLEAYPPQTSSRDSASQWGCYVHNKVNERLKKEEFDCKLVTEHYKCGCADGDEEVEKNEKGEVIEKKKPVYQKGMAAVKKPELKSAELPLDSSNPLGLTLEKEGLTKGG